MHTIPTISPRERAAAAYLPRIVAIRTGRRSGASKYAVSPGMPAGDRLSLPR